MLLCDEITVDLDILGRLDLLAFLQQECEQRGATAGLHWASFLTLLDLHEPPAPTISSVAAQLDCTLANLRVVMVTGGSDTTVLHKFRELMRR